MQQWEGTQMAPPRGFLRMCRRNMRHAKAADSTGAQVNGAGLLMRSLLLRRVLRRDILADDETYVGVLLPPSVGGLVVNVALALDRRIAANLNYTMSSEVINLCIAEAGIRRILTSRRVMERFPLSVDAERIFLDDVREKITAAWLCLIAAARQMSTASVDLPIAGRAAMMISCPPWRPLVRLSRSTKPVGTPWARPPSRRRAVALRRAA